MHESAVVTDLVRKIDRIIREEGISHVRAIRIQVGAFSGIAPEHLREHLAVALAGTPAAAARLEIRPNPDLLSPVATGIWLEGMDVTESGQA